jgi:cytochrome c-type biogenesis protein CcmE
MTATQQPLPVARRRMTRKQRRLMLIGAAGFVLCVAAGLVLVAMRDSIVFFYGPTEIVEKGLTPGTRMRLGGLVEKGSLVRGPGQKITFAVTDSKTTMTISYEGLLPDLFREGQGVVTEGVFEGVGRFRADSVLAKHDETYMPREVADTLKKQGHWQPGGATGANPAANTPAKP